MTRYFSVDLSPASMHSLARELRSYAASLEGRCRELEDALAAEGRDAARAAVGGEGDIASSVEAGVSPGGWATVRTEHPQAAFVEFGVGVVGRGTYPEVVPQWPYDQRWTPSAHDPKDPRYWYYVSDRGRVVRTAGTRAKAFMWEGAEHMRSRLDAVAREVFSK